MAWDDGSDSDSNDSGSSSGGGYGSSANRNAHQGYGSGENAGFGGGYGGHGGGDYASVEDRGFSKRASQYDIDRINAQSRGDLTGVLNTMRKYGASDIDLSSEMAKYGIGYMDRAGVVGFLDAIAGTSAASRNWSQGLSALVGFSPLGRLMNLGDLGLSLGNFGFDKQNLQKTLGLATSFINDPVAKNMARIGGSLALGDTRSALGTLGGWGGGIIGGELFGSPAGAQLGSYLGGSLLANLNTSGNGMTGFNLSNGSGNDNYQKIGKSTDPLSNINWGNLFTSSDAMSGFGGTSFGNLNYGQGGNNNQGLLGGKGDNTSTQNKDLNSYNTMQGTSYQSL